MFSKSKETNPSDSQQREQYEYARKRVLQKKRLMQHFIVFLAGSVFLIIINPILGYGKDFFIKNWFVWAILLWAMLFIIHVLNVFIVHRFMGKEWEDRQIEKLKAKQVERIKNIEKQIRKDVTAQKVNELRNTDNPLKKNENPNQLPEDDL